MNGKTHQGAHKPLRRHGARLASQWQDLDAQAQGEVSDRIDAAATSLTREGARPAQRKAKGKARKKRGGGAELAVLLALALGVDVRLYTGHAPFAHRARPIPAWPLLRGPDNGSDVSL